MAQCHSIATHTLHRPIDVHVHPNGQTLFILDFGQFEMQAERALSAIPGSGELWSVSLH